MLICLAKVIAFIDFEKAFDRVNRRKLWVVMARKRTPEHLIRAIPVSYTHLDVYKRQISNFQYNSDICLTSVLINVLTKHC